MNPEHAGLCATGHPLLRFPLREMMRAEIAMLLRHGLHILTVGDFLRGWDDPRRRRCIEQAFDKPGQARQAAATCAAWMGAPAPAEHWDLPPWWNEEPDEPPRLEPSACELARPRDRGDSQALLYM